MRCPKCKYKLIVKDSRHTANFIRRRRECVKCHNRFTTIERITYEKDIVS